MHSATRAWLVLLLSVHTVGYAADQTLAAPACSVLRSVLPQVKGFKPEGARAQLVMAMAEKFEYDRNRLRKVKEEVDAVAKASCSKERDAWLLLLKMPSLGEALS